MELEKLPKDVIQYLALEMDVGELLSLCRTNKELNVKICKNRNIWINKLNKDFPDWINKDESEKKNLSRLYQISVLDRDFPGWDELPEDKGDLLMLYKKLSKINEIRKSHYGIETDYYMFKLGEEYPDTDFNEMYHAYFIKWFKSGKEFYESVKNDVEALKEKYGYKYMDGDPFIQNSAFDSYMKTHDYDGLLKAALKYPALLSLGLVEYCINNGAEVTGTMIEILKSLELIRIIYSKKDDNLIKLKKLMEETYGKQIKQQIQQIKNKKYNK